MTNRQAVRLFKQKKKIEAEYRAAKKEYWKARKIFEPFQRRLRAVRLVTEIYKGKAIQFGNQDDKLCAEGIGNMRMIMCRYDEIIVHGWQLQVWPSQGTSYITTFWGTKAEVVTKMKDFVATGKLTTQLRRKK